eukprot:TRINITY_DN7107_c0_g1_i1.p1 TRINITY_DN7107_c0_g1~~TRINITY_DN7107_c0_g1_i1.p1  ORF type:complete len:707 (+),score=151.96 TRINITY_DN7107_c0_g1_i1:26-2122(+)
MESMGSMSSMDFQDELRTTIVETLRRDLTASVDRFERSLEEQLRRREAEVVPSIDLSDDDTPGRRVSVTKSLRGGIRFADSSPRNVSAPRPCHGDPTLPNIVPRPCHSDPTLPNIVPFESSTADLGRRIIRQASVGKMEDTSSQGNETSRRIERRRTRALEHQHLEELLPRNKGKRNFEANNPVRRVVSVPRRRTTLIGDIQMDLLALESTDDAEEEEEFVEVHEPAEPGMLAHFLDELSHFVGSSRYDIMVVTLIAANAVWIGVETQYQALCLCSTMPPAFTVVDLIFLFGFVTEVGVRIFVDGMAFFTGAHWEMHVFDLIVVVMQAWDEMLKAELIAGNSTSHGIVSFVRVFRLCRVLRVGKVLTVVGPLRTLIVSITVSLSFIASALAVMLLLTYTVGNLLTDLVTRHRMYEMTLGMEFGKEEDELVEMYGTLDRSIITLFQTITDGMPWKEAVTPLANRMSRWFILVYIAYVSFAVLALMNVITGIFVDTAVNFAEEDKKLTLLHQIREVFELFTQDHGYDATITREEFRQFLEQDDMQIYLQAVGITREEGGTLFDLLDDDESGEVDLVEMVRGCMNLYGSARKIDMANNMRQCRVIKRDLQALENTNALLVGIVAKLHESLVLQGGPQRKDRPYRRAEVLSAASAASSTTISSTLKGVTAPKGRGRPEFRPVMRNWSPRLRQRECAQHHQRL